MPNVIRNLPKINLLYGIDCQDKIYLSLYKYYKTLSFLIVTDLYYLTNNDFFNRNKLTPIDLTIQKYVLFIQKRIIEQIL